MGVTGLWKLLEGTGTAVDLESLEGKVLAVDISIWMHMAVKGIRTTGDDNAHLKTLFKRISKLLYYGIKPVFVFDGSMPQLKCKALAQRRQQRHLQVKKSKNAAEKILQNCLKRQLIEQTTSKDEKDGLPSGAKLPKTLNATKKAKTTHTQDEDDMFKLPPVVANEMLPMTSSDDDGDEHKNGWYERWLLNEHLFGSSISTKSHTDEAMQIDTNTKEFQSLPNEVQHEVLVDMKEVRKKNRSQLEQMPKYSDNFSKYQISGLLAKHELSEKIRKVERKMQDKASREACDEQLDDDVIADGDVVKVDAKNLTCDDETHFVLVTKLNKNKDKTKAQPGEQQDSVIKGEAGELKCDNDDEEGTVERMDDGTTASTSSSQQNVAMHTINNHAVNSGDVQSASTSSQQHVAMDTVSNRVANSDDVIRNIHHDHLDKELVAMDTTTSLAMKTDKKQHYESPTNGYIKQQEIENKSDSYNHVQHNNNNNDVDDDKISTTSSSDDQNEFVDVAEDEETEAGEQQVQASNQHTADEKENNIDEMTQDVSDCDISNNNHHQQQQQDEDDVYNDVIMFQLDDNFKKAARGEVDGAAYKDELDQIDRQLLEKIEAAKRATRDISERMIDDCQKLIRLFGLPYIISPSEAEAQCAWLNGNGVTDGTITDDSDIWLFGGHIVYKNFFDRQRDVTCYKSNFIKSHLGLDRPQLIAIALCSGCDYTVGIDGVGPVRAIEIMNEFNTGDDVSGVTSSEEASFASLMRFKEWWTRRNEARKETKKEGSENKLRQQLVRLKLNPDFPSRLVVDAFTQPNVSRDPAPPSWGIPDLDGIRDFALDYIKWGRQKVDEELLPVLRKMSERKSARQTKINSYLMSGSSSSSSSSIASRKKKSKRLQAAVDTLKRQRNTPSAAAAAKLSESSSSDDEQS